MNTDLTIIICATNVDKAFSVCKNVESTSGLSIQPLICDNRITEPICKVYNRYAQIARSENILLCHQDIVFIGQNWGSLILNKLNESTCGAIGFAGAKFRPQYCFGSWSVGLNQYDIKNLIQHNIIDKKEYACSCRPFESTITLDGLALFVKKTTLLKYPFDETNISGFHCYDIDYSLTLSINNLTNYVVTSNNFTVWHESPGKYNKQWILDTFDITLNKWNKLPSLTTSDIFITHDTLKQQQIFKNRQFITYINNFFNEDTIKNKLVCKIPLV